MHFFHQVGNISILLIQWSHWLLFIEIYLGNISNVDSLKYLYILHKKNNNQDCVGGVLYRLYDGLYSALLPSPANQAGCSHPA